jgi:hypothetical protein
VGTGLGKFAYAPIRYKTNPTERGPRPGDLNEKQVGHRKGIMKNTAKTCQPSAFSRNNKRIVGCAPFTARQHDCVVIRKTVYSRNTIMLNSFRTRISCRINTRQKQDLRQTGKNTGIKRPATPANKLCRLRMMTTMTASEGSTV